ncbi:MAG: ABC transporter permease, partial [Acidobacteria bacterium]|nr:ABC transporter permease [Acidobacteriota bacterium]
MTEKALGLSTRIFHALLRLLPVDFRGAYAREMEDVFEAQQAQAAREGSVSVLRLWWDTLTGIFTTAPREHWEMLKQDTRYALRMMRRNPGFAVAAVLALALGIGANTAIFSVVYGVLIRPLPYGDGDRLVRIHQEAKLRNANNIGFSEKEENDYRHQNHTLADLVEYHNMNFVLLGGEEPIRINTGVVSPGFFSMFGVQPILGRDFRTDDDKPGVEGTLLLSYRFWADQFHGDRNIIGRKFQMNDRPHVVIGVLPPLPLYPDENDVYMPVSSCPFRSSPQTREARNGRMVQLFARMKPGATLDQVRSDMAVIASRLEAEYPADYPKSFGFTSSGDLLREEMTSGARQPFLVLLATSGFVLLIACANVANLTLSRLLRRERELAVRGALGAGRVRLLRQMLTESALLALAGGALGLLLAAAGSELLVRFAARFTPRAGEVSL